MIGILDWELCTLGSPLADLGNILLPFAFPPVTSEEWRELSGGKHEKDAESSTSNKGLLVGLQGLSSEQTGLPMKDELERWWVEGMNDNTTFHAWQLGHSSRTEDRWQQPISGMRLVPYTETQCTADHHSWVRSWIFFRLAVIAQGIAARAALGQASSAEATAERGFFDFFGRKAWAAKEEAEREERSSRTVKSKL